MSGHIVHSDDRSAFPNSTHQGAKHDTNNRKTQKVLTKAEHFRKQQRSNKPQEAMAMKAMLPTHGHAPVPTAVHEEHEDKKPVRLHEATRGPNGLPCSTLTSFPVPSHPAPYLALSISSFPLMTWMKRKRLKKAKPQQTAWRD